MTTHRPRVSFVVPCYRYAHHLPQCLDSILGQTFRDFEVIVMDDCSPDETPAVVARYTDPRIRHVRQPVNKGGSPNLNDGLRMASGRYVWPVSADDYLCRDDALEEYLGRFDDRPDLGFVYSRRRVVREGRGQVEDGADLRASRTWEAGEFLGPLLADNPVTSSGVMIRAECFRVSGYWDPGDDIRYCPDWYLFARLALHFPVGYVSRPAVVYRLHDASEIQGYHRERPFMAVDHPARLRWRILNEAWETGRRELAGPIVALLARGYARRLVPGAGPFPLDGPGFEAELREKSPHDDLRRMVARAAARARWVTAYAVAADAYDAGRLDEAVRFLRTAIALGPTRVKPRLYLAFIRLERRFGARLVPLTRRLKGAGRPVV
jgi:glycosyltransferase involved in cell wall biosynthesis